MQDETLPPEERAKILTDVWAFCGIPEEFLCSGDCQHIVDDVRISKEVQEFAENLAQRMQGWPDRKVRDLAYDLNGSGGSPGDFDTDPDFIALGTEFEYAAEQLECYADDNGDLVLE